MNSNLPPGVSVSDIPGNRPEDAAEEAFWDAFDAKCREAGIDMPPIDLDSSTAKLITIARDLGLMQGFNEGRAEEQMAQCLAEMERAEEARTS